MTISSSYPYLSIAKVYGVDYGTVLRMVEQFRTKCGTFNLHQIQDIAVMSDSMDHDVYMQIFAAASHFMAIRGGVAPFPPASPVLDS